VFVVVLRCFVCLFVCLKEERREKRREEGGSGSGREVE
jgi:hypothetical protein